MWGGLCKGAQESLELGTSHFIHLGRVSQVVAALGAWCAIGSCSPPESCSLCLVVLNLSW